MLVRTEADARAFRAQINILTPAVTDAVASQAADLYPTLSYTGALIKAGTRIRWGEKLFSAQYDTYDRKDTDPDHDANGWSALNFHDGYRDIPETMTTSNMFKKDEIGWWADKFFKSKIDNNSWNPTAYPDGWTETTI